MKAKILTEFPKPLFDAYDISELKVSLAIPQHQAKTLRFRVLLDIKNRWQYEDEEDIELPNEVTLVKPADGSYDIENSGEFEREFTLELGQNFLDGLKDISSDPSWENEENYELDVQCILEGGAKDVSESTTLDVPNPWHPKNS